jgi:hypothetical protein
MSGHAILSPSSAHRWLACTPSARLEQRFPDTAGEAAREGTLCHSYGELLLRRYLKQVKKAAFEKELGRIRADGLYTPDMRDYAEAYAAFVTEQYACAKLATKDALLFVEQKLDLTEWVPEGFGTGDAVIIADGTMHIVDLKYGKGVSVSCVGNRQMMLYALGALAEFDCLYDIREVVMTVYQPRIDNISTWGMPVSELKEWAEAELRPRASLAFRGEGDYAPGEHCRFCRAKAQCASLAAYNLELAKYEFEDAALLADKEVSDILTRAAMFRNWLGAVEEFALKEAVDHGKTWPGFKLVEGRSNRLYTDESLVAATLLENGYAEELIYTRSLLGITAMEKLLTKKTFNGLLDGLVIKPQGKPALAPESDKRPALNSAEGAAKEFEGLELEWVDENR